MKTFNCDACGSLVFFENTHCLQCNHPLGFLPEFLELSALESGTDGTARALAPVAGNRHFRLCANRDGPAACNWMVPATVTDPFCAACRLNAVIPDLSVPENAGRWQRLEFAKRRLLYTLLKLQLPLVGAADATPGALRFRFLGDSPGEPPILTGYQAGIITMNIAEADDAVREQRRVSLHEPLRTLLGHFRHEVAHYYWEQLIAGTRWLDPFRTLFGDERADYAAALQRHYANGPDAGWNARGVTAYASSHPWEDWSVTWAHYFHIVDTIETAAGFGLSLRPRHPAARHMTAEPSRAATDGAGFDLILGTWFSLTYALNSLNRGMGLPDLYPFVLSDAAIAKLRFVHEVIADAPQAVSRDQPAESPVPEPASVSGPN